MLLFVDGPVGPGPPPLLAGPTLATGRGSPGRSGGPTARLLSPKPATTDVATTGPVLAPPTVAVRPRGLLRPEDEERWWSGLLVPSF